MDNDIDAIKAMGEKMMGGFAKPKSTPVSESKENGMFEMPKFGGEEKSQPTQGHDCSCGHESHTSQPKSDDMFGMGNFGGEQSKQNDMFGFGNLGGDKPQEKSKNNAFGSNDDSDELKRLGERMMG